jgi:cytochrome c556
MTAAIAASKTLHMEPKEMTFSPSFQRRVRRIGAVTLFSLLPLASAWTQNAPPAGEKAPASGPSPTRIAVENRRAAYQLIGNSFRYFGAVAKGTASYDEAEAAKRAVRIALLARVPGENFPEGSNVGEPESKAKTEIWGDRADFDRKLKTFEADAAHLAEVNAQEKGATEPLKVAVAALAQDCKGCHDLYKLK